MTCPAVQYRVFDSGVGWTEIHIAIRPMVSGMAGCLEQIGSDYLTAIAKSGASADSLFFSRFHIRSGPEERAELVRSLVYRELSRRACSVIGQEPFGGAAALSAWHLVPRDGFFTEDRSSVNESFLSGKNYDLFFLSGATGATGAGGGSADQSGALLRGFADRMTARNMGVRKNFLRSWIYVRDIDRHYAGMVEARKGFFQRHGLDGSRWYPASTGIGCSAGGRDIVTADFLSVGRLADEQVLALEAPERMPRPSVYGVNFERGLSVRFGDREHLYISGTASIGPDGAIMHPGNLADQTRRTLGNVESLLCTRNAGLKDIVCMNVYLREPEGAGEVDKILGLAFSGKTPYLLLRGPVCRPGWLVEIDATALVAARSGFPDFG